MRLFQWLALGLVLAHPAGAEAPERSHRPVLRAVEQAANPLSASTLTPRPVMAFASPASPWAGSESLRPLVRPETLEQKAMARKRELRRGSVCGDVGIQGEEVGFVPGRIRGCGIEEAVRISSVSGVALSQQATIDCPTAKALKTWVDKSARPALSGMGGGLVQLRVAAHYACRTRNNRPGAKISEHGRGRAIDISGFRLADGRVVSVLEGWNARATRRAMRAMHKGACGPFGTVLGPESDRFHRDHFHFDTARYRSGPYCR